MFDSELFQLVLKDFIIELLFFEKFSDIKVG
jgi:hypothetical protein